METHFDLDTFGDALVDQIAEPVNWAIPRPKGGDLGTIEIELGDSWLAINCLKHGPKLYLGASAVEGKDSGYAALATSLAEGLDGLSFEDKQGINEKMAAEVTVILRRVCEAS